MHDNIRDIAICVAKEIKKLNKRSIIVAIDGRCGSGKSSLATELKRLLDCNVFAMDDFFLQPHQRTKERLKEPGGNVDRERFEREVLVALREGREVVYRPFDCSVQQLGDEVVAWPASVNVVEGTYSCHPELVGYYDFKVFLTVDKDEQIRRIVNRNGEDVAKVFRDRWIPLEEGYFDAFGVMGGCDIVFGEV